MTAGSANTGKSPWADIVGPGYTVESFGRVLGLLPADVADAANELTVLRLRTADEVDVFPAFQVRHGHVYPDLRAVLTTLQSGVDDPWTWALWLNTGCGDEASPMTRLWAGDSDGVLREAGQDAVAWRA